MDSERWQRIAHLFESVLELEPSDRAEFLAEVAAGDDELRREVESLLEHVSAPVLIDRPMLEAAAAVFDDADGLKSDTAVRPDRVNHLFATGGLRRSWDPRRFSLVSTADLGAASKNIFPALRNRAGKRFAIGDMLNARYLVRSALGEGGMGLVYEVEDTLKAGPSLALKLMHGALIDAAGVELFKAEFAIMAELDHPNVARVHDFEALQGSDDYFFTMECIQGAQLSRAVERADVDVILGFVVQVCRALAYLHSRGIVHRDLKPSNVIVDVDHRARVLDFGIAGNHGDLVAGTVAYMAPEQLRGGRSTPGAISTVLASRCTSCSMGTCRSLSTRCPT